jgi:hypothetical protein
MSKHYPVEQRERAVKMVLDHLGEYRSVYAASQAIGPKVGVSARRLCVSGCCRHRSTPSTALVLALPSSNGSSSWNAKTEI